MKILTVGTMKGGTGKTTIAFNISGFLAKKKKRILLIDADPQGNLSENLGFGQDFEEEDINTLSNILQEGINPTYVIIENVLEEERCKIDLIPSNIDLTSTESYLQILGMTKGNGHIQLSKWFEKYKDILKEKYDYVICDVGPNIGIVTQNCLFISDGILLVSDIGVNSFKGAKLFINAWEEICSERKIPDNIKGIIINKYNKRTKLSNQFIEYITKEPLFDGKIFDTLIPEAVSFKYAESYKLPIVYYQPNSEATKKFNELIKELEMKEVL